MASSRVIASSSSGKSNISRQSSLYTKSAAELQNSTSDGDPPKSLSSMIMDDLIRNIYSDNVPAVGASPYAGSGETPAVPVKSVGVRTTEDVWREITAGRQAESVREVDALVSESESKDAGEMTLEDFLARAGAVIEEEVRVPSGVLSAGLAASDQFGQEPLAIENPVRGFGNGTGVVPIGGGRNRRRPLLDPEDRITLQRQKRMIKNRESAARSRERKQAYTSELESLVHQLEQENTQLHIDLEQGNKERFKQVTPSPLDIPCSPKTAPALPTLRLYFDPPAKSAITCTEPPRSQAIACVLHPRPDLPDAFRLLPSRSAAEQLSSPNPNLDTLPVSSRGYLLHTDRRLYPAATATPHSPVEFRTFPLLDVTTRRYDVLSSQAARCHRPLRRLPPGFSPRVTYSDGVRLPLFGPAYGDGGPYHHEEQVPNTD